MDIERLYQDFHIPYATEGHKHCRPGWVQTACPFCTGNPGLHLGFNIASNRYVCWRCGGHYTDQTLEALLHLTRPEINKIIVQYGALYTKTAEIKRKVRIKAFKMPSNTNELQENHIQYLEGRGFNAKKLQSDWGLLGTGVSAILDKSNYKHRIMIPFFWDTKLVTFDSRDITGKAIHKYMACPLERELIPHKSILYGKQEHWKEVGICVEGPTDVWRMGFNSFATSGIKYTPAQLRLMAKIFKRIHVLFDDDPQAIKQANKLVADLRFRGVDANRVDIVGDPGGLSQEDANYLIKQLI